MERIEYVVHIGMNLARRILFDEEFAQIPIRLRFEGVAQDFAPIVMENIGRFHIFVLSLLLRAVVRLLRQNSKLKKRNGVMTRATSPPAYRPPPLHKWRGGNRQVYMDWRLGTPGDGAGLLAATPNGVYFEHYL